MADKTRINIILTKDDMDYFTITPGHNKEHFDNIIYVAPHGATTYAIEGVWFPFGGKFYCYRHAWELSPAARSGGK